MYHAGWAWAGDTPFRHTKLIASHFGGTRNPMVDLLAGAYQAGQTPRSQFHHVNDVVPTIYEILGIKPPKVVDGFTQDPIDGVSIAYTFADAKAPARKRTQYFDNNGSRGIYHDGWYRQHLRAADPVAHGESGAGHVGFAEGRLGALQSQDRLSQADDLAAKEPKRLEEMKDAIPERGKGEQGLSDRRRHLAAAPPGGSRQDALHELAVRCDDHPHA